MEWRQMCWAVKKNKERGKNTQSRLKLSARRVSSRQLIVTQNNDLRAEGQFLNKQVLQVPPGNILLPWHHYLIFFIENCIVTASYANKGDSWPFMFDQGFIRRELFGGGEEWFISLSFIIVDISGFSCTNHTGGKRRQQPSAAALLTFVQMRIVLFIFLAFLIWEAS